MNDILALIPARGGSKSVPRKNVRLVAGKPLIAWSIEAARSSDLICRVVVSTDDPEIAEVSRQLGAEIPFMRPPELARDETPALPVLAHALNWLEYHEGFRPEYLILLQPTSPLRTAEDIDQAIRLARSKDADSVISVTEAHSHPYWTKTVTDEGRLEDFIPTPKGLERRQDLPPAYMVNGAIYIVKPRIIIEEKTLYTQKTYAYIMLAEHSIDIDKPSDMHMAELLLTNGMLNT